MQPVLSFYKLGTRVTAFSTTRQGGCSEGNYAEFNINCYCGDSVEHIRQNRAALCSLLGIADDRLIMPHQVHDTVVATIDESFLGLSLIIRGFDSFEEYWSSILTLSFGLPDIFSWID